MQKLGLCITDHVAAAILLFAIQAQGQQERLQAAARALGSTICRLLPILGSERILHSAKPIAPARHGLDST